MNGIYFIIGGNLGDRLALIEECKQKIKKILGPILRSSSIYESESWGETNNPNYLNQVLFIESKFFFISVKPPDKLNIKIELFMIYI